MFRWTDIPHVWHSPLRRSMLSGKQRDRSAMFVVKVSGSNQPEKLMPFDSRVLAAEWMAGYVRFEVKGEVERIELYESYESERSLAIHAVAAGRGALLQVISVPPTDNQTERAENTE